ncbi:Transcription factor [Mycena venus]|uniref:Transcription factor n=1 Tax=Mycena venus TaxID=2733690 RepID=A0A8H6YZP9_9AGAR|nr:Transcription factor [Mycena venus]
MASDLTLNSTTGKVVTTIPKLLEGGTNWVSYKERMTAHLLGQPGFRKHLMGRAKEPQKPEKLGENPSKAEIEAYEIKVDAYEDLMDEWLQKQAAIMNILIASWPEEIHQRLIGVRPASALWNALCERFENQGVLAKTDLLLELTETRCTSEDPEDALKTIERLIRKRNEYILAGGTLTDDVYAAILTKAMPKKQRPVVQTAITTAMAAGRELDFTLVHRTLEQSIKFEMADERREREEAMAMAARYQRQQQPKGKVSCTNCGYNNHTVDKCYRPGGGAEGQGPPKWRKKGGGGKKGKAAAAQENEAKPQQQPHAAEDHAYMAAASPSFALRTTSGQTTRLLDTGASQHYDGDLANFVDVTPCAPYEIQTASGLEYATKRGTTKWECYQDGVVKTFSLSNTYYLPSCTTPLISLSRLRQHGLVFSNEESGYGTLTDTKTGRLILRVAERDGVYPLTTWKPQPGTAAGAAHAARRPLTRTEAHERLGHLAHSTIEALARNGAALNFDVDLSTPIVECPGDFVSGDLWGPASVTAKGGYRYYGTFLDDNTDIARLYLQKSKEEKETLEHYKAFEAEMKTQHSVDIKCFGSDRGREYTGGLFDKHLAAQGTRRELNPHDTPQKNGAAERLNGTLGGHMRAMLIASGLPKQFWGLAVVYAVWLRNRTPTKKTAPISPYERLTGNKPDLRRARPFGSKVWVRVVGGSKLDPRGVEAVWVGPSVETPDGHKVYWPKQRTITVERNVRFEDGTVFGEETREEIQVEVPTQPKTGSDQQNSTPSDMGRTSNPSVAPSSSSTPPSTGMSPKTTPKPVENQPRPESNPPPRRLTFTAEDVGAEDVDAATPQDDVSEVGEDLGRRIRKPSAYVRRLQDGEGVTGGPRQFTRGLQVPVEDPVQKPGKAYAASIIPRSVRQAERSEVWVEWKEAMETEIKSLDDHETYSIVPRSDATSPVIPLKWVFDNKTDSAGDITQRKARIVARGDYQNAFGAYGETFAPVLKPTSRNILLAIAAHNGWNVRQCDFRGAYLNGVLPTPVYVEQPEGFDSPEAPRQTHIWKLHKALYGLKDAGRIWYDTLCKHLFELGFTRSGADHSVFYRITGTEHIYLGIHVDDTISTGNNLDTLIQLEQELNNKFPLKIIGDATHFLGISIQQDRATGTISLGQTSYIDDVVALAGLENAKPASSPLTPGARLTREFCPKTEEEIGDMRDVPYRAVVGSLIWIANHTRADIAYATSLLSQFLANPGRVHWEAAKHVVRYLKGTRDKRLTFGKTPDRLAGYSDSSWGSEALDWRSMSGYAFILFGGAICWSAKKQTSVALSTAEAEYIALARATKEVMWIRTFMQEVFQITLGPIAIHVDNQAAIAMAKNDSLHSRTKHIALPYHFVRHAVASRIISLTWIASDANVADIFTKPLDAVKTLRFTKGLGLTV